MVIEESGLQFEFSDSCKAIKFDNTDFYRKFFNKLPSSKGVDFISDTDRYFVFTEVKNCTGDENNCNWRVFPNSCKVGLSPTNVDVEGRDSVDIETAKKVAMTMAALLGSSTFGQGKTSTLELKKYISALTSGNFSKDKKRILVILVLEGDFGSKTASKKMIMKNLQDSLNKKLCWLKCRASVVDSNTYDRRLFRIIK